MILSLNGKVQLSLNFFKWQGSDIFKFLSASEFRCSASSSMSEFGSYN